jgi:hypothetical protein
MRTGGYEILVLSSPTAAPREATLSETYSTRSSVKYRPPPPSESSLVSSIVSPTLSSSLLRSVSLFLAPRSLPTKSASSLLSLPVSISSTTSPSWPKRLAQAPCLVHLLRLHCVCNSSILFSQSDCPSHTVFIINKNLPPRGIPQD